MSKEEFYKLAEDGIKFCETYGQILHRDGTTSKLTFNEIQKKVYMFHLWMDKVKGIKNYVFLNSRSPKHLELMQSNLYKEFEIFIA